eukprot:14780971-Ditylum_brightwellii.AAC.1
MFHGVDGGVDGGEIHFTHLTQEVDCCLMERKKQNVSGECQDHEVLNATKSRSVLYDSAKLNDGKEVIVGVDDCVDNCFDGRVDSNVDDSVDVAVEDGVDSGVD